jgi:cobalt-zinc-cadmium efflux system outer membrane protein
MTLADRAIWFSLPFWQRGSDESRPAASRRRLNLDTLTSLSSVVYMTSTMIAFASGRPLPLGSDVTALLAIAHQTSPEVAAAALDAEAARAKVASAGALPDPVASVENEDFSSRSTSGQGSTVRFRVMQEFPLWGKRELQEDIAGFDALAASHRQHGVELDLADRIKSVFAARRATYVALDLNRDIRKIVDSALTTARGRFAQNAATQEDVTKLEIEVADLDAETARLEAQTVKTAAQLNALLSRRIDAPLAKPAGFRKLPPDRIITVGALADRAVRFNTNIAESEAKALGAAAGRELADRNRYPDISAGPMYSQENSQGNSHFGSVGVSASFTIPLQWDAKEADIRAAAANKAAADERVQALKQRIAGEVAGMVADYKSTSKSLAIMRDHHLHDAQIALNAALGTIQSDTPSLSDVFTASERIRRIQLDILKLETEQQIAVAEIEKIIGGDL